MNHLRYNLRVYLRPIYKSVRQCSSTASDEAFKRKILQAALSYVPTVGWTEDAVALAVKDAGFDTFTHRIFDNGAVDLVTFFMESKRENVNKVILEKFGDLRGEEIPQDSRNEIIYSAIEAHMDYIAPHISSWPSAMAVLAEPSQLPSTIKLMTDVADDICHHAGLTSSRLDWYVDRGLVLGVFCSTELFMLTDYSPNLHETR
jgi:ubiquinone biosynthesis protein COQ9